MKQSQMLRAINLISPIGTPFTDAQHLISPYMEPLLITRHLNIRTENGLIDEPLIILKDGLR